MALLGLIIGNKKYENKDLLDLPKVADDVSMMNEMLGAHDYKVKLFEDVEDIGEKLEEFRKSVFGQEIDRLHFHFSGHGVNNARIHVEKNELRPEELERIREGSQSETRTTNTPVGECLFGRSGQLYSVHDLKSKLLDCGSKDKKITTTLDCCRVQHRGRGGPEKRGKRKSVKLKEKKAFKIAEQEKIAVVSGSLELHPIDDNWSLTKELYKVTEAGKSPVLLVDIAKKVNASWKESDVPQRSKIDLLEDLENWADYMWPTSKTWPTLEASDKTSGGEEATDSENMEGKDLEAIGRDLQKTVKEQGAQIQDLLEQIGQSER